jgi:uncharacterized protein YcbX
MPSSVAPDTLGAVWVAEVWRYPIKSLAGERLSSATVEWRGLVGDRRWALVDGDGGIASGKTTRRFRKVPGLLKHRSRLDSDAPVLIHADGRSARAGTAELDQLLADIAPAGWSLQPERRTPHFDDGAVHLVTTATLSTLSRAAGEPVPAERLRPNLVLAVEDAAPFPEDGWLGRTLHLGGVELRITKRAERCVMVGHAQHRLALRPTLLKTIGHLNGACAGVYAEVSAPGTLVVGYPARLL